MATGDNQHQTLMEATSGAEKSARFWLGELRAAGKVERDWRQLSEKLVKRYRNERKDAAGAGSRLNIFYSNVELLKPRVYSQVPAPDVRRRTIVESDPARKVGRQVATLLENALSYAVDAWYFDEPMLAARDDLLITGRGLTREVLDTQITQRRDVAPLTMPALSETGEITQVPTGQYTLDGQLVEPDFDDKGAYVDQVVDQRVNTEFVFWADFRMSPARCWRDVWWIAFRHPMDREQLKEEFGKAAAKVPLVLAGMGEDRSSRGDEDTRQPADPEHPFGRAVVWEVWDKRSRKRIWVAEGHEGILRDDGDPLGLEGFYPTPGPVYAIKTTDTMVPRPEFEEYRDQAEELDHLETRISDLRSVLKAVGLCDGDAVEMLSIRDAKDGTMIPIGRPGVTADDFDKSYTFWRINEIQQAITGLRLEAQQQKLQIFEITGLSDLSRGAQKERESAAASKIKVGFGDIRMTPRAQPFAEMIRDTLRIKAEIMAEHFDPAILSEIGGIQVDDMMLAMMRDEKVRNTKIEVQTDSTVRPDRAQDRQDAMEFLTATAQYLGAAAPLAMQVPQLAPMLLGMLREAAKTFKFARNVEDEIDAAAAATEETQNKPDPAQQAAEAEAAQKQAEMQAKMQAAMAEEQRKAAAFQAEQMRLQAEFEAEQRRKEEAHEADMQRNRETAAQAARTVQ